MASELTPRKIKQIVEAQKRYANMCRDRGYTNFIDHCMELKHDVYCSSIRSSKKSIEHLKQELNYHTTRLATMDDTLQQLKAELDATQPNTNERFQARRKLEYVEETPMRIKSCKMSIGREEKQLARFEKGLEELTWESHTHEVKNTVFKHGYAPGVWDGIEIPEGITQIAAAQS